MAQHPAEAIVGRLAFSQAAYFLVTGVWPLVDMRSFEQISGPKAEDWLAKTVGVQVGVVGGVLALAASRRRVSPEIELLAITSAAGLAAIDVIYVSRRRIRPIYLVDAVIELGFIAGWISARRQRAHSILSDG